MLTPWKESCDQPRQYIEKQRHYFVNKGPSSQGYGFSSGHAWMWELDYKESWAMNNWCFWTVVLEKTLESPLDCKEIQPVHPKVDQSWVFIGRTDVEAETPVLWPPDGKCWLIWKEPNAGKGLGQEVKGTTEDEMFEWCHQLNGHGFGWTPGVGDGQGGLACCGSWGCKELDMTERLNWTKLGYGAVCGIRMWAPPKKAVALLLCHICVCGVNHERRELWYGCPASQERINVSAAPMASWVSFQYLSLCLAYRGISEWRG